MRHRNHIIDSMIGSSPYFKAPNVDSRMYQSDATQLYSMFECCTQFISQYSESSPNDDIAEIRRILGIFGDLLRDISDRTDGFDCFFKKWLKNYIHTEDKNVLRNNNSEWFLILFVILIVRHLVSMDVILEHLCNTSLNRILEKITSHKLLDQKELLECKNLAILVRLLLIQDGGERPCSEIVLSITDVQVLQHYCETLSQNNDFARILSGIFQKFAVVELSIDLNNPLVSTLQQLRSDFPNVYWFKQMCSVNIENIYHCFVKDSKKLFKIEKYIIEMIQATLGGDNNSLDNECNRLTPYIKIIPTPINLWNFQKSRIDLWLYMDKIMLTNNSLKNDVIKFFWEELILNSKQDSYVIAYLIRGMRDDVVTELFEYGMSVLKRCMDLVVGIEEIFRALLIPLGDEKKLEFCQELYKQVKKILDESINQENEDICVSGILSRIRLLILGTYVLTGRVSTVFASNNQDVALRSKEYTLIVYWIVILVKLLCDKRIHRDGGGAANFDLILDLVCFLLDEIGRNARLVVVAELRKNHFNIPTIWSNRIKRVLPLSVPPERIGESHTIDPWLKIESSGERGDINSSPIDLSWYNAKAYPRPTKRLKRPDNHES
ncbi:hypothetical protein Glove_359g24 [Diversispora epigaea]|uniref:Uncharacterized protein n=1 Tax=Diversispora epigaea TaxID=1348612 RepID=A0A397HET3_9GLOM|nr:hypothetical protein Glove_359g24 [Diversispora epigaea]